MPKRKKTKKMKKRGIRIGQKGFLTPRSFKLSKIETRWF